jgi:DsbC/DsbD-like thiol-disulfide interchange protein
MRAICAAPALLTGLALTAPATARAGNVAETQGATLRLIRGATENGVAHLGLEIAMKPGWHTYWRYPGDSGVPPEITLAQGDAAKGLTVAYPAPQRFGSPGDETIGYNGDVVLPLSVTLAVPARAQTLSITARLGICHDICLPVDETLSVAIDPASVPAPDELAQVASAEARVPKTVESGAPHSVASFKVDAATKPATVDLTLQADDATIQDVFVEGPEGWALPLPKRMPAEPRKSQWQFALDGLPSGAKWQGVPLTVTVVGTRDATTQMISLK